MDTPSSSKLKLFLILNAILGLEIFFAPVIAIFYIRHIGISFDQFAKYQASVFLVGAVLEIPTGVISDLLGRRRIFQIGQLVYLVTMVAILVWPLPKTVMAAAFLFPLGACLSSGNLEAISWEYFASSNRLEEYKHLLRKTNWLSLIMGSLGAIIGGKLSEKGLALPFLMDTIALAFIFIAGFMLIPVTNEPIKFNLEILSDKTSLVVAQTIETMLGSKQFLLVVVIFATLLAILRGTFFLYQPMMSEAHLTLSQIGGLIGVLGFLSGTSGFLYGKLNQRLAFSYVGEIALLFFLAGMSILAGLVLEGYYACLGLIFFQQILRGLISPTFNHAINAIVSLNSAARTSLLSFAYFAITCTTAFVLWLIGMFKNHLNYLTISTMIALVFGVISFLAYFFLLQMRKRG